MKILIAEDNPICRRQLETLLTRWGYEVVVTSDGEQAWRFLSREDAPELAILDWMMPGLDGTDVCSKVRERDSSKLTYIILLTAKGKKEDLIQGFKAGADDYMKKPFDPEELHARVQVGARIIELERKLAEHAKELEKEIIERRKTEERYRDLIEKEKDIIYALDNQGNITFASPAVETILGYRLEEVIGKHFIALIPKEWQEKAVVDFNNLLKTGEITAETVLLDKEKQPHFVEYSSTVINEGNNVVGTRGIVRDITERKRTEEALRESEKRYRELFEESKKINREFEESNRKLKQTQARLIQQEKLASIGQLAAGIAHELNNPLGFITSNFLTLKNYLKTIEEYLARLEELASQLKASDHTPVRENIHKIEQFRKQAKLDFILQDLGDLFTESARGFDRIISIVQSLRSFSRVDQIKKIENYDIHRAIEDTLTVARNEIKYVAEVEKQFSEVSLIEGSGNEINQVLLNIIVNAAQAIKSQNRSELGKITIKTYQTGDHVYCEISDDGPGIEEKIQSRIFEPFFTTKPVGQGTGLGLNISYDIIVNKHKGDLTMKSVVGEGTTFTIKLPIRSPLKQEEIEVGGASI